MTKRERAIQEVNKILLDKFDFIEEGDLPSIEDHSLLADIGIDSINVWELEMEFEHQLNCTINESSTVRTYGELVDMYENNLNL